MQVGQTTHQLTIRHRSSLFKRLFWELFGTGFGTGLLLWSGPATLNCQRLQPQQVTCQFSTPGWLGVSSWRERTIRNLQGVTLSRSIGEEGGAYYKVMLQTSEGEIPLRPYQTSGLDNTRQTVKQLQTFLNDPMADRLSVFQVDWLQWFGLVSGALFFLPGLRSLYITFFSLRAKLFESYRFDQTQSNVTYEYGGLLRRSQRQYLFSDIQRLILDSDPLAKAWVFLELRSGEMLCLNRQVDQLVKYAFQGAQWQELQPLVEASSQLSRLPWQLAIGYRNKWLQVQMAQNKRLKWNARLYGIPSEPASTWIFDRSTHTVTHQHDQEVTTYPLKEMTEVQVTPIEMPLAKKDSDGDTYYIVSYQLSLILALGQCAIQTFSSREYDWHPDKARKSAAQEQAEEAAQRIRQYINRSAKG